MKGSFTEETIRTIRESLDIVDIASEYITLKKSGRNYLGLCPFHAEKTPSFNVNTEKQIFHCFGCGEGGDIFSLVMKINNITFPEAVRILANKAGITLLPEKTANRNPKAYSEREKLININLMAADFFTARLFSEQGQVAQAYLEQRALDSKAVRTFRLGYAPEGWENLKNFLLKNHVPKDLIVKSGLVSQGKGNKFYDRFRGRLIFPIFDLNGSIIAFGGRIIGPEKPKYINSPESPIYSKGRNLYGLYQAKESIRKEGNVIIVEGYFDLLMLWQAGISNVAATLGTALTMDHVQNIRRLTGKVIVMFDSDAGGRSAIERSLPLFLNEGIKARIAVLPEKYDPADYVTEHGKKGMEEVLKNAPPMIDYYIDNLVRDQAKSAAENFQAASAAVSFIRNISSPLARSLFTKRVSDILGIEQNVLQAEIGKLKMSAEHPPAVAATSSDRAGRQDIDKVELALIHIMIEFPSRIPFLMQEKALEYLCSPELKNAGTILANLSKESNRKHMCEAIGFLEDNAIREKLFQLSMEECPYNTATVDRVLSDTIKKIKDRWIRKRHKEIKAALLKATQTNDAELRLQLLYEKTKLLQKQKELG